MRVFLTALAYVVSLALVAVVAFFVVFAIAGPHSGQPRWLEIVVLILGWSVVLVVPVLVARLVWRRTHVIRRDKK